MRFFARVALSAAIIALALFIRPGAPETAQAQGVNVSVEFRTALEPHGRWQRHSRYGEVWVPASVDREWRPYTRGRWVYTEDWGWYWVSGEEEAEWGWVAYHYGRWVRDREVGWVWVPGEEWGPAWVSWRRGGDEVGWAPLPPEDYYDEVEDDPDVWIFVQSRDVIAPSLVGVLLPRPRASVLVRETVVVNRTVYVSGARVAANVGVPPAYLRVRVPVARVRPVVLRGTVRINNAIEVDARERRGDRRARVERSDREIEPTRDVPQPRRFERGRAPSDTPDAPRVLRQAQPQDASPDAQKKDAPKAKDEPKAKQDRKDDTPRGQDKDKRDDDRPKAKDDRPKAKDERTKDERTKGERTKDERTKDSRDEDRPKGKKEDRRDEAPKAKEKRDEAPKARPDRDEAPKARQQKRDDDDDTPRARPQQQKQPSEPVQKQRPQRDDGPGTMQKKSDGPRGDAQPQQQPQRRELPQKQDAAPRAQPQQAPSARPDGPPAGDRKKDN